MTTRTRTRGSIDGGTQEYQTTTFAGSVVTTTGLAANLAKVGEYQYTTDVVTPRFHTRIAAGEIINNPFESVTETWMNTFSGHHIRKSTGSGSTIRDYEWSKGYVVHKTPDSWRVDTGNISVEASTLAAANVEKTNVDGVVEAAEGRQTMNLFNARQYDLRRQVQKEIRYAERRGRVFPGSVPLAVMSNNWLMYRYGIMPFVRLLHDTIVVGSRIQTRRQTARGFAEIGGNDVFVWPPYIGGFHDGYVTRTRTWSANCRAGILYERLNFTNKYGFSLSNVPQAIWEATPWSFVVDWFANMGTFIGALTPRLSSVRRATWRTVTVEVQDTYSSTLSAIKGTGYYVVKNQSGDASRKIVAKYRVPNISAPTLYIRENALSEIVTSQRIVDAFALTTQLFLKLMRRS